MKINLEAVIEEKLAAEIKRVRHEALVGLAQELVQKSLTGELPLGALVDVLHKEKELWETVKDHSLQSLREPSLTKMARAPRKRKKRAWSPGPIQKIEPVRKVGNAHGILIAKSTIEHYGLEKGSLLEMIPGEGEIILRVKKR